MASPTPMPLLAPRLPAVPSRWEGSGPWGWRRGPEGTQTAMPAGVGLAAHHCPSLVLTLVLHIPEPLHFVPQQTEAEGPYSPWHTASP